ncbi:MAG TPA: hypothetical protein VJG32_01130 [Anaerolineae bacterium]|nr:hypothetical protein [Anaerolineae bacterium]
MYRDIFSHHFPFVYYWTAAVFTLAGPSLLAARLSLLLFQVVSFAWAMKLTHLYVPLSLASLIWNIVGHSNFGNMVLYSNFAGVACAVVFSLVLSIATRSTASDRRYLLTLAIFSLIAILSDPLSIYGISLSIASLVFSKGGIKHGATVTALIVLGLGLSFGVLWMRGALPDFYEQVIAFNSNIYSKYTYSSPDRLGDILRWALNLFYVFDRSQWSLFGFIYRPTIILIGVALLAHRRFLLAGLAFIVPTALLVISANTFRSNGFVLVSLITAAWFVVEHARRDEASRRGQANYPPLAQQSFSFAFTRLSREMPRVLISLVLIGALVKGVVTIVQVNRLSYKTNFGAEEQVARYILSDAACGRQDVALAFYPDGPLYNFLTQMPPVAKYLFMWPWVAEVAASEVIERLEAGNAVVYLDLTRTLWGKYPNKDYLAALKNYLDVKYEEVDQGFYVSPDLAHACHPFRFFPRPTIPREVSSGELVTGVQFTQTFLSHCAGLTRLELYLATYARVNTSAVVLQLTDLETDRQVFQQTISGVSVADNQWYAFSIRPLLDSKSKRYSLSLLSPDGQPGNAITVWRSRTDVYPAGAAFINREPAGADFAFRYACASELAPDSRSE